MHFLSLFLRHIELDRSHLEKREQMLEEEASRRAISFISEKERLSQQFETVEVLSTVRST